MSHQVQSGLLLHLVFGNGKVLVEKRVCAKAKWVLYKGLCKSPAKYRCQLTLVHNRLGRHRTNEEHVVIGNTCLTLLSENVQLLFKAEPRQLRGTVSTKSSNLGTAENEGSENDVAT